MGGKGDDRGGSLGLPSESHRNVFLANDGSPTLVGVPNPAWGDKYSGLNDGEFPGFYRSLSVNWPRRNRTWTGGRGSSPWSGWYANCGARESDACCGGAERGFQSGTDLLAPYGGPSLDDRTPGEPENRPGRTGVPGEPVPVLSFLARMANLGDRTAPSDFGGFVMEGAEHDVIELHLRTNRRCMTGV